VWKLENEQQYSRRPLATETGCGRVGPATEHKWNGPLEDETCVSSHERQSTDYRPLHSPHHPNRTLKHGLGPLLQGPMPGSSQCSAQEQSMWLGHASASKHRRDISPRRQRRRHTNASQRRPTTIHPWGQREEVMHL